MLFKTFAPGAVIALAVLIGSAFDKPAAEVTSKPVSRYMRDMGIRYLETVEELSLECGKNSTSDDECMSRWESTIAGLEDRINIALSDKSRRSSGDVPYWDLLKTVRYARKVYVTVDADQRKTWSHVYVTCEAHAHTIALQGIYFNGDGGCGEAIHSATNQGQ